MSNNSLISNEKATPKDVIIRRKPQAILMIIKAEPL